jgi:hypothetical protein
MYILHYFAALRSALAGFAPRFMHAVQQTKGRQLSKEVKKRRNESFPSTDEQSGASWISRFWGKFQTFTERV